MDELSLPTSTSMAQGNTARAPIGYINLCRTTPEACDVPADEAREHALTEASWNLLDDVNSQINARIRPRRDPSVDGRSDIWSIDPPAGDCEDYALTKRDALTARGWPARALSIAVVRDEHGTHHAVLVARTDRGDFVLDNRRRSVVAWSDLPYRWIKLQSGENPREWVQLAGYVDEMIERKAEFLRRLASRD